VWVDLVSTLKRMAEGAGSPLAGLRASRDRYGPVDAFLLAPAGFVSVRTSADHGYEVMVWDRLGDLLAWGHTDSTADVVETMQRWQADSSIDGLTEGVPYLAVVDGTSMAAAFEALWQVVLRYDGDDVVRIASAAMGDPTLRRLRPWVGHGTLHLLHADDRIDGARLGLAFYSAGDERWRVDIYSHQLSTILDDANAAVTFAARGAANW
jgi:hypothetical protein